MFSNHHTVGQIKSEYRRLAKLHHPDLGGDLEKMKQVNLQYHAALLAVNGQTRTDNGKTFTYKYNEKTEQAVMDKVLEILALNLDNLEIEIIGIWVWVSGSTKDQKDLLNRNGVGLKWHSKRLMWYWKPYRGKTYYSNASTNQLRQQYGSRKFQAQTESTLVTA
jgi:hypothetical protein